MIEKGYPFYGHRLGILVFDSAAPRIPGDPGHAASFPFSVCYQVVQGGFSDLVTGGPAMRASIREAGLALRSRGIRAVLADCGLMALYQQEMPREWGLPFAASSLCQIPTIWQMMGQTGRIGIITGHSEMLSQKHLSASGCDGIPLVVQGMEDEPHFAAAVLGGSPGLDPVLMRRDVLSAGQKLLAKGGTVCAVVLECSNLPTYSAALRDALGLPVFDIMSAAGLLAYGVAPPVYPG